MAHLNVATIGEIWNLLTKTVAALETPTGGVKNAQGNADGAALVEITGGTVTATVDTSLLAKETTVDEVTGASKAASATGALTKSDDTVYSPPLKVIYATGSGNLVLMLADDTTSVITVPVDANEKLAMFRIRKVMAATTATGISGAQ